MTAWTKAGLMEGQALFDKVVTLLGVSSVLAPGLVRRALLDGKVQIETATPADYRAAMPRVLARLRAYMSEEEAQRRARRITSMLAQLDTTRTLEEDEPEPSLIGRVSEPLRGSTPADGTRRPSPQSPAPQSGEHPLDDPDDEPTVLGRRYTAHELEVLRKTNAAAPSDPSRSAGRDKDR